MPQLGDDDASVSNVPDPVINIRLSDNGVLSNLIQRTPENFQVCVDWDAKPGSPLTTFYQEACQSLGENSVGVMDFPLLYFGGKPGEMRKAIFRTWLRFDACTHLTNSSSCEVPSETGLPDLWVQATVVDVPYSFVVPDNPAKLSVDYPGQGYVVGAATTLAVSLNVELSQSAFSETVRASAETWNLCCELSTVGHHHSSRRCAPLLQGFLDPLPFYQRIGEQVSTHLVQAWLESSAETSGSESNNRPRFLAVGHEFESWSSPLACSRQLDQLDWDLAAKSGFHVYKRDASCQSCRGSQLGEVFNPSKERQLLITAAARSGTHYSAAKLNTLGVRVRHEGLGPDGSVSWLYAHKESAAHYPINRPQPLAGHRFCFVFHQVRHPLRVISSNMHANKTFGVDPHLLKWVSATEPRICGGFNSSLCGDLLPGLVLAARFVFYWNSHIEKIAHVRFRVEDTSLHDLCRIAKFPSEQCGAKPQVEVTALEPSSVLVNAQSTISPRNHGPLNSLASWESLEVVDSGIFEKVREMTLRYGYLLDPAAYHQESFMRAP
jgi:hypothetical protein